MRATIAFFFVAVFSAGAQVAQLRTLNELVGRPPAVDKNGRGETVSVLFGWNTNDWGGEQRWTYYPTATDSTNAQMAGPVVAAKGGGRWKHERATWDVQDARLWSIKADGVTDDTAAWQAALDYPAAAIELRSGTTSVVTNVKITRPKRIIGNGATIVQQFSSLTNMVEIKSSDVQISDVRFNARTNSNRGILITDDVDRVLVEKCYFKGFRESLTRARIAAVYGWGNNEVTIRNCWFEDFYGYPNGVIGDDLGDVKGIYFRRQFGTSTAQPKRVIIDGCVFIDLGPGEDTDAVHYVDSTWTEWDSTFMVGNCYGNRIGKRFVKASGSGASIFNNFVTNNFDGSIQASGWASVSGRKAMYSVVSLYGKRHTVSGNRYNGGHIRMFGDGVEIMEDCTVIGNTMILSTNWGLPGVTTNDFSLGTIGFSLYAGKRNTFIGNTWETTQYGFQLWNPASENKFIGNRIRNPWSFASQNDNVSRGVRIGRPSAAYPSGSLMDNEFVGNTLSGFKIGVETQEGSNTVWVANNVLGATLERSLIPYESGSSTVITHPVQFTGGSTANLRMIDPVYLAPINADTYASTADRGQLAWDIADKSVVIFNGRDWDDAVTETRRLFAAPVTMVWTNVQQTVTNTFPNLTSLTTNVFGGATNVFRSWWRVAELNPPGYGSRGSAIVRVGSGGGMTADSSVLRVSMNFQRPSLMLLANSPSTNASGPPLYGVRVVLDEINSKTFLEVCPSTNLSLAAVTVTPEWQTVPGLEPTNAWRAIAITNTTILLTTNEAVSMTWTNLESNVMAYKSNNGEWSLGRNEIQVGTNRFTVDAPPSANATAMSLEVNGVKERVWRDTASGALYTGTPSIASGSHTHDASAIVTGVLNVARVGTGSGSSAKFLDGTGAFSTPAGGSSAAWNGVTNVAGLTQLNIAGSGGVTISTNPSTGTVTISGPPASTNSGSVVSVDGTYSATVNIADSPEVDGTLTGTNASFALKSNSVSSNKLDAAVITALNARGLGTNLVVNGTLQQPARITNAPAATIGGLRFFINANGDIEGYSTNNSSGAAWNGVTNVAGLTQLNIAASGGVTISTNPSTGTVTISGPPASTNSGSVVSVDGTYSATVNIADSPEVDGTLTGTNASFALKSNSVSSNKLDAAVITALNARGLGTNLVVNGTLQQPARITNAPAATTGGLRFFINANGDVVGYATNLPSGGSGYLPLTAGSTVPLTGPLHFFGASGTTQVILANDGDITDGHGHIGFQSNAGKFQVFDMSTNGSFTVIQTLLDIDPATSATTNIFKFGTYSGREDWMIFQSERFIIPTGTIEVGGTNLVDKIIGGRHRTLAHWSAREYIPDAANAATFSTRSIGGSLVPSITFDPATAQGTSFEAAMPDEVVDLSAGVTVKLFWSTPLASAGSNVVWTVTVTNLCCGTTANASVLITNAPSGVANEITNSVASFPLLTNLTVNGLVKVGVSRAAGSASDVNPLTNELRAVKLYLP